MPLETRAQRFSEAVCKKAPLNCWALESLETGELEPLELEPRLLAAILAQVDQLAQRKIPALPPRGLCLPWGVELKAVDSEEYLRERAACKPSQRHH